MNQKIVNDEKDLRAGSGEARPAFFRDWSLKHWNLVNRLARKRFSDETLAEEAALWVLEQFEAEEWRTFSEYSGSARLKTYFSSVVYNRLEDFSRKRFGRVRPPQWLKKLGGVWMYLYRLLCLERFPFEDALHRTADRYPRLGVEQIEPTAERILGAIPSCGQAQGRTVDLDVNELTSESTTAALILEGKERELFLSGLYQMLVGGPENEKTMEAVASLADCRLELSPEERLLLKLCHREGYTVTEAGRKLGLSRFQAHGKMRRVYKRVREMFERAGCHDEIRLLLDFDGDTNR